MIILLDIDGVLVTTPAWQQVELLPDGFMKFNERAVECLLTLFKATNASIVLSTTHRISFDIPTWQSIFKARGLPFEVISKLNDKTHISQLRSRGAEIEEWVNRVGHTENYVIIDDDRSVAALPQSITSRWVATSPLIGFDKYGLTKALQILKQDT